MCFSGKAYPPEFYYDTYSALWQNKPRVYGFKLQWTQMNPNAVDRIMAYRLGIKQVSVSEHLLKDDVKLLPGNKILSVVCFRIHTRCMINMWEMYKGQ